MTSLYPLNALGEAKMENLNQKRILKIVKVASHPFFLAFPVKKEAPQNAKERILCKKERE